MIWEYKVVNYLINHSILKEAMNNLEKTMNNYGKQGWKLVSLSIKDDMYVLKRQKVA